MASLSTGLSIHVHADIRHSRHMAYLHRFHFKPQLLRPLVVRCFRVIDVRVVGFVFPRLLQLNLSCGCYSSAIIRVQ